MKTLLCIVMSALMLTVTGLSSTVYAANASIKMVQETLVTLGYDPGTPDGSWGGNSRRALNAFQTDNGFKTTHSVSKGLIELFKVLSSGGTKSNAIPIADRVGNTLVLQVGAKVYYADDGRKTVVLPNGKRIDMKWRKKADDTYCEFSFSAKRETCEPEENETFNIYTLEGEHYYFQKTGNLKWRIKLAEGDLVGKLLTNAEIKEAFAGKSFTYTGRSSGSMTLRANGTVSVNDDKFGTAKGKWWVKNNQYCRSYPKWNVSGCQPIAALDDGTYTQPGYIVKPE